MELILTSHDGHVFTITLNRPEKRNALSNTVLERLGTAVSEAGSDREIRVVVLRGAGPVFCAGVDLSELIDQRSAGAVDHSRIEDVLEALEACPKPTIAMVHGDAIAGGCELALHCDLRIAAADARFGMPVARLGIATPYPLTLKLVETIGAAATKELLFSGQLITADRALSLGLVNRVVPPGSLEEATAALATTIAANAPLAVQAMKQYALRARQALTAIPHEDLGVVADRVRQSADVREGLLARREKRRPNFRGQ
jgi:enoyl-CoA hydratase/carnithine racemase